MGLVSLSVCLPTSENVARMGMGGAEDTRDEQKIQTRDPKSL